MFLKINKRWYNGVQNTHAPHNKDEELDNVKCVQQKGEQRREIDVLV